jgi:isoquinoline 1-oxidoreductase beta subunit
MTGPLRHVASRRTFLKAGLAVGGGLAVGVYVGYAPLRRRLIGDDRRTQPQAWIRVDADNTVTVTVNKSEMGQGVYTALPMLVAEELDADWSTLRVQPAPVAAQYRDPIAGEQITDSSNSIRAMWTPLREAGAAARALLLAAAAERWGVEAGLLKTERGAVIGPRGRRATYGELAARAASLPLPARVAVKDPAQFALIGKPLPRLDTPEKLDGTARYGVDVSLPGLLTAVIARAPTVGAKLRRFDAARALAVDGVVAVLPVRHATADGVAVLARGFWAAARGRAALALEWHEPESRPATEAMRAAMLQLAHSGDGAISAQRTGDARASAAAKTIEAVYEVPYLAHAAMEPLNCTAWVRPEVVEVWVGTQAQEGSRNVAARAAGVAPEQVTIHTLLLGGGFGRRLAADFVSEAVQLARAARAPVKVMYTREDDLRAYHYRPMSVCRMTAALDAQGQPLSLQARVVCDSISRVSALKRAWLTLTGKPPVDGAAVSGLTGLRYAISQRSIEWVKFSPGVRAWYWRSVGHSQNVFFIESFIDELAHAAGRDPVAYRRALLGEQPRLRAVLELAATKARWGAPLPTGRARGVALCAANGSFVAQVAEVALKRGRPRVQRVVIAADVGLVVNPDTVAAQLEGAMAFGLSAALHGRITLHDGQVEQSNFHDYPVLRMDEMPAVEVHLVPSAEAPGGVGEPGTPPIAPAVANALFVLTGRRQRRLPLGS